MRLNRIDIATAIQNNDIASIRKMLGNLDIYKEVPPLLMSSQKEFVLSALGYATSAAWVDKLSEELTIELIDYTAMTVNMFSFIHFAFTDAEEKNFDIIPKELRKALLKGDYDADVIEKIEKLDADAFAALLPFIFNKVEDFNVKLNPTIFRRIHTDGLVPDDLLFAFMGLSLRDTVAQRLHDMMDNGPLPNRLLGFGGIGPIGGILVGLGGFPSDRSDDGDDPEDDE